MRTEKEVSEIPVIFSKQIFLTVHKDVYTFGDASAGVDSLFANAEFIKFRERADASHVVTMRVFPLGSFFVFFSGCPSPTCYTASVAGGQEGLTAPVYIEFTSTGTKYGLLGGEISKADNLFTHEDPHDLAIHVLDAGHVSEFQNLPDLLTFPSIDFVNLTFIGFGSFAPVNWTIDNSK